LVKNSENAEITEMPEVQNNERYLTTSQAAGLLHVASDTVLKWVRAGKIRSYKTLGGHFRIPVSAVEAAMPEKANGDEQLGDRQQIVSYQYCWEYFARGNDFNPECRECITYRSGSKRCYELRDLPGGLGCLGVYCVSSCAECEYYKLVGEQGPNVLIVTRSKYNPEDSMDGRTPDGLKVKFVENEYECAAAIEKFRPDCIVVDCSIGKKRTKTICRNLFDDPRLPVVRIILASGSEHIRQYCDKEIYGWIKKPFSMQQLRDCIKGM
jgi:excisionase family DNA binding protein